MLLTVLLPVLTFSTSACGAGVSNTSYAIFVPKKTPESGSLPVPRVVSKKSPDKQLFPRRSDLTILPVLIDAKRLSDNFHVLFSQETAEDEMRRILETSSLRVTKSRLMDEALRLKDILQLRLEGYDSLLREIVRSVRNLYRKSPHHMSIFKTYEDCCAFPLQNLAFDPEFNENVNRTQSCDLVPDDISNFAFYPSPNLTKLLVNNLAHQSGIRWQYFVSMEDLHVEYPAHKLDFNFTQCLSERKVRHRDQLISTILPYRKHVALVVDRGGLIDDDVLRSIKAYSASIVSLLSAQDRISLILVDSSVEVYEPERAFCGKELPGVDSCGMRTATQEYREVLARKIKELKARESECTSSESNGGVGGLSDCFTDHTLAIQIAFQTLQNATICDVGLPPPARYVLYVSRGMLSTISEAGAVMYEVYRGNERLNFTAVVNTLAMLNGRKKVMLEKSFLEDLAAQNFTKYSQLFNLTNPDKVEDRAKRVSGKVTVLNSLTVGQQAKLSLRKAVELLSHPLFSKTEKEPRVPYLSFPWIERSSKTLLMSATRPVFVAGGQLIGIAGLDFPLADLTDFMPGILPVAVPPVRKHYLFLTDTLGQTIWHPKLKYKPGLKPSYVRGISPQFLEGNPGYGAVARSMSRDAHGIHILNVSDRENGTERAYVWSILDDYPINAVVVGEAPPGSYDSNDAKMQRPAPLSDLKIQSKWVFYHRLDLLPSNHKLCLLFEQVASTVVSAYFLSARCFERPFLHLSALRSEKEEERVVTGQAAYLLDETRLIAAPGIKHGIREEVALLAKLSATWVKLYKSSTRSQYVLRRYMTSGNGVLLVHPATMMPRSYEPTDRPWYTEAVKFPGKLTVTGPYLDQIGAGYIVTMSRLVNPHLGLVMAVDISPQYLHSLVKTDVQLCQPSDIHCFLFEDEAYVVGHPGINAPLWRKEPSELHHLAHREPELASELLQHRDLIRKQVCLKYPDLVYLRYYKLNMSLTTPEVFRQLRKERNCAKYHITHIPLTNVFLAAVNQSCHKATRYCWCSIEDRRCINCNAPNFVPTDQSQCECPCECEANGMCEAAGVTLPDPCPPEANYGPKMSRGSTGGAGGVPPVFGRFTTTPLPDLPNCMEIDCRSFDSQTRCSGVIGCEWCQIAADGKGDLPQPYCSAISDCFGGVYGASPMMAEMRDDPASRGGGANGRIVVSTPVGPVAGGIMAMFAVMVVGVYCYRHQMSRLIDRRSEGSSSDGLSGSRQRFLNGGVDSSSGGGGDENDPDGNDHDTSGNIVLASFERENMDAIATLNRPALMLRRHNGRPITESSDHGYSTMTPTNAEDSERATTIEPVTLVAKQKRLTKHDPNRSSLTETGFNRLSASPETGFGFGPEKTGYGPAGTGFNRLSTTSSSGGEQETCLADVPPGQTCIDSGADENRQLHVITAMVHQAEV